MCNQKYAYIAFVISPHGIKGELKIKVFIEDNPKKIEKYSPLLDLKNHTKYNIKVRSVKRDIVIAILEGIDNRDDAEKLRAVKLFAKKDLLPVLEKNSFYGLSIIGLKVFDMDTKEKIGLVKDFMNYGAGDILEIALNRDNKSLMLPFKKSFIPIVNVKDQYIIVKIPQFIE